MLQKEAVCGWDGKVWVSREQVYRKSQEAEEEAATEWHHGRKRRFQKYKKEKMERNEILVI